METRHLKYFVAVVDHGGVSAAAEPLNMTQPSLSQAIRTLERETGVLLFRRLGRKMLLTPAGEELLSFARHILAELDRAQAAMDSYAGLQRGSLVIAATANDSFYPLAKALARYHKAYPEIEVRLLPAMFAEQTIDDVVSGRADLGFLPKNYQRTIPDCLREIHVSNSQMYIAVSPTYRTLGDKCTIEEISDIPMITRPKGTYARTLVDRAIAQGVKVRVLVDSPHDSILPRLIADGMGCAVMPSSLAQDAALLGASIAPLDPPEDFEIMLVYRDSHLNPAARRFLQDEVWKPTESMVVTDR